MLPYLFAAYPLSLVLAALVWLIRTKPPGPLQRAMLCLACGEMVLFAFLAGSWVFTSYFLRYLAPGIFLLAAIFLWRRPQPDSAHHRGEFARLGIPALVTLAFGILIALTLAAYRLPGAALNLSFPLASGSYCVVQGGNSIVTNPFHALSGSWPACDIVKLNALGNRADSIAPRRLTGYEIFGDTLYSPCAGSVSAMRDGLPDSAVGHPDVRHPEGNFLVLSCAGAEILLAHLKRGSVAVEVGERVHEGQPIGKIGNSGNSLEPHLHISATVGGAQTGMSFDNRILSVNSIIQKKEVALSPAPGKMRPPSRLSN